MTANGGAPAWRRLALPAAVALVTAFYFFQSSTLAPNQTDEGLLLQYVDAMAHGERPFFDFVDAYGLLNWVFPVAFYRAFGDRVWGVRVWMVVLKVVTVLLTVLLTHALTREPGEGGPERRGSRFYPALAGLFATTLLGAQWQSLQTPYAFLTVLPPVLGTWYFVLCAPLRDPRWNVRVAGILTAVAIWTKLNTGMFLLAAGLFVYFFLVPSKFPDGKEEAPEEDGAKSLANARTLGAAAYVVLFSFYIRRYYSVWFFLFLTLPLVLAAFWTVRETSRRPLRGVTARDHLTPFASYLGTTAALSLVMLFGYYGRHAYSYVRELAGILSNIRYTAPFPPLGVPGTYIGLNEFYWLELPWLFTALFAAWSTLAPTRGPELFGASFQRRRAQLGGLFVFVTLHGFCMYARADETHLYQTLVVAVPLLFVFAAQLDTFLHARRPRARFLLRFGVGGFGLLYCCSLAVLPSMDAFDLSQSEWNSPKLEHLRYRRFGSPHVREFTTSLHDHDWDVADDETARYVQTLTLPGEEMLLLTANRLIYLNSGTHPIGGRYHFFFYLASVGLLDRKGFDALVPQEVVLDIVRRPPRVIVGAIGWVPLAVMFPEFKWLRDNLYEETLHFKHIVVHELRRDGKPLPTPLR